MLLPATMRRRRCCVCLPSRIATWIASATRLPRLVRWCAMSRDPYYLVMVWFMLFTVGFFIIISQIVQKM